MWLLVYSPGGSVISAHTSRESALLAQQAFEGEPPYWGKYEHWTDIEEEPLNDLINNPTTKEETP